MSINLRSVKCSSSFARPLETDKDYYPFEVFAMFAYSSYIPKVITNFAIMSIMLCRPKFCAYS